MGRGKGLYSGHSEAISQQQFTNLSLVIKDNPSVETEARESIYNSTALTSSYKASSHNPEPVL